MTLLALYLGFLFGCGATAFTGYRVVRRWLLQSDEKRQAWEQVARTWYERYQRLKERRTVVVKDEADWWKG